MERATRRLVAGPTMDYQEWNRRICDRFFNQSAAGKRVVLQIDPDELAEIGEFDDPAVARDDFCAALRKQVDGDTQLRFLPSWMRESQSLRFATQASKDCPPFIALLAGTLLAGFEMEGEH